MSNHEEFPDLTLKARAAYYAAIDAIRNGEATISIRDFRRALAAFQREAIRQARRPDRHLVWGDLEAIAANLHNPLPPPPTLAQAREADLSTPEGQTTVNAFLASLGEGVQP